MAELADTINRMVDDLNRLAVEVSRVANATVGGVSGSKNWWTRSTPCSPVSEPRVRAISEGDLTQRVEVPTTPG